MANIPGTLLSDGITIGDTTANKFGSHFDFQGTGGFYSVEDIPELYAIPVDPSGKLTTGDLLSSGRRRLGMHIYVRSLNKYFRLTDPLWNTYTTDAQRHSCLASDLNWRDASSDPVSLPDGTASGLAMYFASKPNTGFYLSTEGLNMLVAGKRWILTTKGIETVSSNTPASMSIGEGNVISNNYSYVFGSYSESSNYVTTAVGTVVKAQGQYTTAVGSYSSATANHSTVVGVLSTTSGFRAAAFGNNLTASGGYSSLIGNHSAAASSYSCSVGSYLALNAGSDYSALIGAFLSSSSARSIVIGSGIDANNRLNNNKPGSIFLGVNSTSPSLFVGGGNGTAGSLGNVGVNLTDPTARLDILSGNASVAPFRIRKNAADKAVLLEGEFQFAASGRLQFSPDGTLKQSLAYLSDIAPAGAASPLTTKGDLWGFSGSDTRIPVGSGFLASSPSSTTGVVWRVLTSADIQSALSYIPESLSNKGVAGGYCDLDSAGKVPLGRIPQSLVGATIYQGTWNAATNSPALASSLGTKGHYYVVSLAGATSLNGISDWKLGDWAIYNGTVWEKVDNTDALLSFNTRTGAITLLSSDVTSALGYVPYNSSNPAGYTTTADLAGRVSKSGDTMSGPLKIASASPLQFTSASLALNPLAGTFEWNVSHSQNIAFTPLDGTRRFLAFQDENPFLITGYSSNSIKSRFGNLSADGLFAFAIGNFNKAQGNGTFACGNGNNAYADYSFSCGVNNTAAANNTHVEGANNIATSNNAHVEGFSCSVGNPVRNFTVDSGAIMINGNVTSEFPASLGIFFYNLSGAAVTTFSRTIANSFFNGFTTIISTTDPLPAVTSGSCVVPLFGQNSHAQGQSTIAKGIASHAQGNMTQALGNYSHAQGFQTVASGYGSTATGNITTSSGYFSYSQGNNTLSSSSYSHAQGSNTVASGGNAHAQGSGCTASGLNSHAQGENTTASGSASHSEGYGTTASYSYAHAGGLESVASKHAQFARSGGKFLSPGDAQYSQLYAKAQTTSGSITEIMLSPAERVTIPLGKVWGYRIDTVAKQTGGTTGTAGTCIYFESKGLIKNIGGVITLIGDITSIVQKDSGTNAWMLAVSAGTSFGTLKLDATGEAGKNINWFSTINLYEVA